LEFRKKLENVAFVVERSPMKSGRSRFDASAGREECDLLGLYEGTPKSEYAGDPTGMLPDKITLFQDAIEAEAENEADVPRIVRETVWHEIAHYFGFDEEGAQRVEKKWL
jgi:predicted Zn-dependent protease with MMP-like domain